MWWDDAWAILALLADVACLIVTVLEQPVPFGTMLVTNLPPFIADERVVRQYPSVLHSRKLDLFLCISNSDVVGS